jgi:hypothetical protein
MQQSREALARSAERGVSCPTPAFRTTCVLCKLRCWPNRLFRRLHHLRAKTVERQTCSCLELFSASLGLDHLSRDGTRTAVFSPDSAGGNVTQQGGSQRQTNEKPRMTQITRIVTTVDLSAFYPRDQCNPWFKSLRRAKNPDVSSTNGAPAAEGLIRPKVDLGNETRVLRTPRSALRIPNPPTLLLRGR